MNNKSKQPETIDVTTSENAQTFIEKQNSIRITNMSGNVIGENLQVIIQSQDSLFANKINSLSDKVKNNKNPFHYLNANLGYYGRETERVEFIDFLESDELISTIAVTGYGGSGKSKFVYETITQLQSESDVWKFVYLDRLIIRDLSNHVYEDYSYTHPLCLIIDYAGRYADEIGSLSL